MSALWWGGVELGGTWLVCAVGRGPGDIKARVELPTTTPEETLAAAADFFLAHGPLRALGVASFGPLDLNRGSGTWGHITDTPKPGWSHVDVAGTLGRALKLPVSMDTDVNGAALAEWLWGAGRGVSQLLYLTVGTGVGGGVLVRGKPMHGLVHPEVGHMLLPRVQGDEGFTGACPYHGAACLEGLASGPALEARWGKPAPELPAEHPAWNLEASYLAMGLVNLIYSLSPQRIILGGGVMQRTQLYPAIRRLIPRLLGRYLPVPDLRDEIDTYLVPPALGDDAGVLGALALAMGLGG